MDDGAKVTVKIDKSLHVLIAGAGIGGLTAALALLRRGIDCDLYEQAPELREIGAGLQLSPNGTRVLFDLGLEPQVRREGVEAGDKVVRLWSTGQTWSLFDSAAMPSPAIRYGAPVFLMHRGDLHAMLVDAVRREKPDAIHLSARCCGMEQDADQVRLTCEDGRQISGDILIGADGLHSRIRQTLFGPASPKFTGIMAWRGLAPMARLPAHLRRPVASQWLGPTGHVTCYPVHRGELLNMVGEVEREDWQPESWVEPGSKEECLKDFEGWNSDLIAILESIDSFYKWGLFLRDPLATWSKDRVTLLGDACHAMLPFLGQGANIAIEDAMVLARCIDRFRENPSIALKRYESVRAARAIDVVNRSAAMAGTFHNDALCDDHAGAKYIASHWGPDKVGNRYDSLYLYNAGTAEI